MKILIALFTLAISSFASAEFCSSALRDQYSQYDYQIFTRSSYSRDDACAQAIYDCRAALYDGQSQGRYNTAVCVISDYAPVPQPPRQNLICRTDLVDYWGNTIRQFTAQGMDAYSACRQSDEFCKYELARGNSNAVSCVNRGIINSNPYPYPTPPVITEECRANRLDPAGMFVQSYLGRAQGPRGTDVKGAACNSAMNSCYREIVGRQTCQVDPRN
jgi:hypothetical protein